MSCELKSRSIGTAAIKEDILRVAKLLGHQPSSTEYEEYGKYHLSTVQNNYKKGWREVLITIGLVLQRRRGDPYTVEEVLSDLQAVRTKIGHLPSGVEYSKAGRITVSVVKKVLQCNKWTDVLIKTFGVDLETAKCFGEKGKYRTIKQRLDELKSLAVKLKHTPSQSEAKAHGIATTVLRKRLQSDWAGVCKAAGLSLKLLPEKVQRVLASREDIIKDIRKVASRLGKTPSAQEYKQYGRFTLKQINKRMGKWMQVIREAGLDLTDRYDDKNCPIYRPVDYYLAKLRKLATQLGHTPNSQEAKKYGVNTGLLYGRLGVSWSEIVQRAGLKVTNLPKYSKFMFTSNEQILIDFVRVARKIGHWPSMGEYNSHGNYLADSVLARFGGRWANVKDAARRQYDLASEQQKDI
ncbi:MAG: hypothetical protein AB1489_37890 [Acidobacteriota bacterium]